MASRQRLIVCLDGTWNQQDSSTNVLHHFNLICEGVDPKSGLYQRRQYHRGVGTGVLDSITGGGFGFGLEQNVRDAYNWLVEHYCGHEPDGQPDEIYIFGFSRGAYTARSLVGFIGQCGLLRRGAPIPVGQLWEDYCILGRQKEERSSKWESIFWKPEARVRPITEIARADERHRNPGERLLFKWSRRVDITYLGIYDTVGAIGWDALAIPGVTSRMALHNNLRPTTIIRHCRHALALDEHRSSFNHTPFLAYIGSDEEELARGGARGAAAGRNWDRMVEMWKDKIEQRWFVGAHSNVGGGYENNRLAERPFQWIVEGATNLGLAVEQVEHDGAPAYADQPPRDSYAEFAPPLWTKILRAKPNYRAICPDPVPQASAKPGHAGFSLRTIHEDLDPSVTAYWTAAKQPIPPNLEEYLVRTKAAIPDESKAAHKWLSDQTSDFVWVILWAALAAAGLFAVDQLIGKTPSDAGKIAAYAIAFLLPLVDWSESRVNFEYARGSRWRGPFGRAFLDAVYWTRAFGFVLAIFGLAHIVSLLAPMGWRGSVGELRQFVDDYWRVPLFAVAATAAASRLGSKSAWKSLVWGPAWVVLIGGMLFGAGWLAHTLFPELPAGPGPSAPELSMPGLLLALQMALFYFSLAKGWTAEPMAKANLGSVVPLQNCRTPQQVAQCLEGWRKRLVCRWDERDRDATNGPAAQRMRELLGQVLGRDMIGFIPVYSAVFFLGLWFGHEYVSPWKTGLFNLWWLLPPLAAVADYIEDCCHLRYRFLHWQARQPSSLLTHLSWTTSMIKDVAALASFALTIAAVLGGTWLLQGRLHDWRAKIALLVTVVGVAAFLVGLAFSGRHKAHIRRRHKHENREGSGAVAAAVSSAD
jgi:uncharacterized protein (DUF2235 family)